MVKRQPAAMDLLRAEILLTTPSAFVLPRNWQGSADRPERQASLEYIEVQSPYLGEYREIMRKYIGPAAAKLVQANRIGTFRTMETAAVLYRDPALKIDWNQIHLCEVDADGFNGFGQEFDAALREVSPDGGFRRLRRPRPHAHDPRWTFNDPVVEADAAVGQEGRRNMTSPPDRSRGGQANLASKPSAQGVPWTVDCQRRSETGPARRGRSRPLTAWRPENLPRASFETGHLEKVPGAFPKR